MDGIIKKAETSVKLKAMVKRAEFMANRDEMSDSEDDDGFGDYQKKVIEIAQKILSEPDEQARTNMMMKLQGEDEGMFDHVSQVLSQYMGDPISQGMESTAEGGAAPAGTAAAQGA
jgi:hypothetical protein